MKKKKVTSRLLAFFLALTMAVAVMPAVNVMAASKLATPTKVKISKFTTKNLDKYTCGANITWSKVKGASMYKVSIKEKFGKSKDYYGSFDYYTDGSDTNKKCLFSRSSEDIYIKATVTALGKDLNTDSSESKESNNIKIPKEKGIKTIKSFANLSYEDNCGYAKWGKNFYGYQNGKKGKTVTVKNGPSRKGYKFLYWVDKNGKKYTPGSKYKLNSKDNNLFAIWQVGKTKVKLGSGSSLSAPSKVKLTAKSYHKDGSSDFLTADIMFHASWSKVEGAYGYLLYLNQVYGDTYSIYGMSGPRIVLGEDTTSYDFSESWIRDNQVLAVRPITKSEFKNFSNYYTGNNYAVSSTVKINELSCCNNYYSYYVDRAYSPSAIKFSTNSKKLKQMNSYYVPSGEKIAYWWDKTTRKKVKNGQSFKDSHELYAIWK